MIYCNQEMCRHCVRDLQQGGAVVCALENVQMLPVPDGRDFILKCNSYKYRLHGTLMEVLSPHESEDGLYPGQLQPPIDMSDYDSEDLTGDTLVGLDSLKDCKT